MEMSQRNEAVSELRTRNKHLTYAVLASALVCLGVTFKLVSQSEIIMVQTPGMPANSIIERTSFDKNAQLATLNAITNNLGNLNPANAEYQKKFLELYFSPEAYTRLSHEIDLRVEKAKAERELGSSYFVFKRYIYDEQINKHFIVGEQHTVSAAKDSAEPYVYEYAIHIENYRLWVDDIKVYPGEKIHNSEWIKANSK